MGLFGKNSGKKMTITVPDMHCQHCVMRVQSLLEEVEGVQSAKPDLKKQRVTLTVDPSNEPEFAALSSALEGGGYTAQNQ
jgi:copper chaperone CopZ